MPLSVRMGFVYRVGLECTAWPCPEAADSVPRGDTRYAFAYVRMWERVCVNECVSLLCMCGMFKEPSRAVRLPYMPQGETPVCAGPGSVR